MHVSSSNHTSLSWLWRRALQTVKARCDADGVPLGGLINNAGIALAFGHTSHKDLVDTVKVNFEGLVQCTQSFLPLLQVINCAMHTHFLQASTFSVRSQSQCQLCTIAFTLFTAYDVAHFQDGGDKDPRIVMVSSAAGPNFVAKCDHSKKALLTNPAVRLDQLHALVAEVLLVSQQHDEAGTSPIAAFEAMGMSDFNPYGFSKALVNAYAMYAARQHPDVVINSCTPGMIDTDLSRNAAKKLGKDVKDWGAKSPEHGAKCPVYIMLDELPTPRGEAWFYGSDCVRSPLHKYVSHTPCCSVELT